MNQTLFWAILIKSSNYHIGNIKIDPVDDEKNCRAWNNDW